jgi:hypothetical protein
MPHPDFISTPDSLRCQLQRGRGEGYRRLLTVPEEEAHALLVDCITHDPRMDSQVESRDWYYAHAAVATDLPLEPLAEHLHAHDDSGQFSWNTPLTVMTLAELAARSYKNAREILCDYISWGEWWNWPIDDLLRISDDSLSAQVAAAVEKHFLTEERLDEAMTEWPQDDFPKLARFGPRIAASVAKATATQVPKETPFALPGSYSVQDLLDLAPTTNLGGAKQIGKAIAAIVKPSDVDVLVASVSITDPLRSHVAMAGLERLAPTHLHEWLKNLWLTVPFQPDPADKRINRIIMRQAICRLFRAFSPEATLPLARAWFSDPDESKQFLAEDLLQHHATVEDLPLLKTALQQMLTNEDAEYHCRLITAFDHLPGIGLVPELLDIFHQFRFSMGRAYAAQALWVTAPDDFRRKLALECLWDCESGAREAGASAVSFDNPGARQRLEEMAGDILEEDEIKNIARTRSLL